MHDESVEPRDDLAERAIGRETPDSFAGALYTARQAARLIGFASASRIYPVFRGLLLPRLDAVLAPRRDHDQMQRPLSFLDLIDARFLVAFRMRGMSFRCLRAVAETMLDALATPHPFAHKSAYSSGGAGMLISEIFRQCADATGDKLLRRLATAQAGGHDEVRRELLIGMKFDKRTRLVRSWAPRPRRFPAIVIDPKAAAGQPAGPSGVPTARLYTAWKTERRNSAAVADLYGVSRADVLEAVRFEESLGERAPAAPAI